MRCWGLFWGRKRSRIPSQQVKALLDPVSMEVVETP